jgi:hypothetical protein
LFGEGVLYFMDSHFEVEEVPQCICVQAEFISVALVTL